MVLKIITEKYLLLLVLDFVAVKSNSVIFIVKINIIINKNKTHFKQIVKRRIFLLIILHPTINT